MRIMLGGMCGVGCVWRKVGMEMVMDEVGRRERQEGVTFLAVALLFFGFWKSLRPYYGLIR